MSMSEILPGDEETLKIPSKLLKEKVGFAFDIGGSLVKLAYTSVVDADTVQVHFVSYPREQIDQALQVVIDNCHGYDREKTIITCGVGGHQFTTKIREKLNIKTENILEMDSFVRAFGFMTSMLDLDSVSYPSSKKAQDELNLTLSQMMKSLESMGKFEIEMNMDSFNDMMEDAKQNQLESANSGDKSRTAKKDASEDVGTCDILCMVGSGTGVLKVNDDKTFEMVDVNNRSGRMFLAIGSLMTGAKSYKELIELASKGDKNRLNILGKDLKTNSSDDPYAHMSDDVLIYSFGQAVWKNLDDFNKEDLAAACLAVICQDTIQCVYNTALYQKPRAVYFCGSFTGLSETVRTEMETAFLLRNALTLVKYKCKFHFLRHGGYLGAFGNLLKYLGINDDNLSTTGKA